MTDESKYAKQLRSLGFKEHAGSDESEMVDFELALVNEAGEEVPTDIASLSEEVVATLPCFYIVEFGSVAEGIPALSMTMAFDEHGGGWVHDSEAVEVNRTIPEFVLGGISASLN